MTRHVPFYFKGDVRSAAYLLGEAVRTGKPTDLLLRNMAIVQKELGDTKKELDYTSKVSEPDFLRLRSLRADFKCIIEKGE